MRLFALLAVVACNASPLPPSLALRDGDIVFQHSRSRQSRAVQLATGSEWTHMGIVLMTGAEPYVLEAIEPVSLTRFADWQNRGAHHQLVIKRLRTPLTGPQIEKLHALGQRWLGRHYDALFRWDDERLYCSELVYKLLDAAAGVRVGELHRARDFNLARPEVQALMKKRFGAIPFNPDETVISPQQIFDDPQLTTLFAN